MLQNQLAECRRRGSDQACVGTDALDRPASVTPMTGRHVFGDGRVLVIAAHAHVRGYPLALEEDFDRLHGQPRVDLGAGEAMGNAIVMLSLIHILTLPTIYTV